MNNQQFPYGDKGKLGRATQRGSLTLESCIWIVSCLAAFVGVLTAAHSEQPLFWLLIWPVPVACASTIFMFIRHGFHFRDGVLVLGRR